MKQWKLGLLSAGLLATCAVANAADISGEWKTVDDKTGYVRAIIKITNDGNGKYNGVIKEKFALPDTPPNDFCKKCPAPYANKPIVGLQVLHHLEADPNKENYFINGELLDPLSGKFYKAKGRLNGDGNKLFVRGYVGVSALGRSQVWLRAK